MYLQQGDVLIKKIKKIPGMAAKKKADSRGYILAEGEATGHAHVIADTEKVELFERAGVLYLRVEEPAKITHEEHNPIEIEKGDYEIGIVQEYDHFAEEARRVVD